jgi:hypothetical protein
MLLSRATDKLGLGNLVGNNATLRIGVLRRGRAALLTLTGAIA